MLLGTCVLVTEGVSVGVLLGICVFVTDGVGVLVLVGVFDGF